MVTLGLKKYFKVRSIPEIISNKKNDFKYLIISILIIYQKFTATLAELYQIYYYNIHIFSKEKFASWLKTDYIIIFIITKPPY